MSKVYLYRICNRPVRSALERKYAWFVWEPLDLEKIDEALDVLPRDARFFLLLLDPYGQPGPHPDHPRYRRGEGPLRHDPITVEADGFLRYMVRTIVGALVDVGRGKCTREDVAAILAAKDRRRAGLTAPPQGLFLKEVKY